MNKKDIIKFAFIIVLILALGCLALNQAFSLYYKAQLLSKPCDLCRTLNPHYEDCFQEQSTTRTSAHGGIENNKIKINYSEFIEP